MAADDEDPPEPPEEEESEEVPSPSPPSVEDDMAPGQFVPGVAVQGGGGGEDPPQNSLGQRPDVGQLCGQADAVLQTGRLHQPAVGVQQRHSPAGEAGGRVQNVADASALF